MEQKDSKIFNKETLGSVESFCKLNNIEDKEDFIYLCFKQGFDIKKFGLLGETLNEGEKDLKKGGIEEKRVEIEVIREIRVEVPVEKIVERIVNVTDDTKINELLLKIQQLEDTPPRVVEVIKEVPVDRVVIQEKIVETIKEVPIEVIKEVIKEVPVEVVKEIIIEKESDGNWKPKLEALQNTVQKLKQDNIEKDRQLKEYEKTIEDIQRLQENKQAVYLNGSNLSNKLNN